MLLVLASSCPLLYGAAAGPAAGSFEPPVQPSRAEPHSFTYRQVGASALRAYVFLPQVPGRARPAVLLFHGGAWRLGEPARVFDRARELAAEGVAAIPIEYRLSNDGLSPIDGVEDACAAFAWARGKAKELGIDPKRVAGYGVSAGGHLVAAAATLPSVRGKKVSALERPDALLLVSPALDMARNQYFVELMAGHGDPARYSPAEFVRRTLPPTLIIQGDEDTIVLARDARAFCAAARMAGARCELHVYPRLGHLLTRNLKVQYKDFDSDPVAVADAHRREERFLVSLGYVPR